MQKLSVVASAKNTISTKMKKNISTKKLKLLDNIQFIYELNLASLELEALQLDVKLDENFRKFEVFNPMNLELLQKKVAYFQTIDGIYSDYYYLQKFNQTKSANQFLTHWIYPYKGKFHPQMIRALLNIIGMKSGEILLDPFVGSGTAILEAQLLGINGIGIDISPLCVLISKVKTQSLKFLEEIKIYQDFYLHKKGKESSTEEVKNFYKVAEMMAHSDNARRKKDFASSYIKDALKMLASVEDYKKAKEQLNLKLGKSKITQGDTRNIRIRDNFVDGIITSPPYSIALNYVANDAHSLQAMGYDLNQIKEDFIGVRGTGINKFQLYEQDMQQAYDEMYRILKKGKYCAVVIGNVAYQGEEIDTAQNVENYCQKIGFKKIHKIAKIIYGLYNVMQKEYILIFQK